MRADIQAKNGLRTLDLNRRRAIRERCLNCSAWVTKDVEHCSFTDTCPLWPYRMGRGKQNAKARDKALKSYCVWCMAGSKSEVSKCVSVHCALFMFRTGRARKSLPVSKTMRRRATCETISSNEGGRQGVALQELR